MQKKAFSFLSSSPLALSAIAIFAFIVVDFLPGLGWIEQYYLLVAVLEGVLTLQLIAAWRKRLGRIPFACIGLLLVLFFLRLLIRIMNGAFVFWAFRTASVYNLLLGAMGYGFIILLHPALYDALTRLSRSISQWSTRNRIILGFLLLCLFAYTCISFRSYHITRDGFDWIDRATKPVWHLYMREPLTIGLYQLASELGWNYGEMTSFNVIGMLSILAGLWWAVWMNKILKEQWPDGFDRLLAWLLLFSSGGVVLLFFAHIEVYPVFIAGLTTALYCAQRYLHGKGKIAWVALSFSAAFLLHLSAGWLLPAFILLPFFRRDRTSPLREAIQFIGLFALIQIVFWWGLILGYYHGSLTAFSARFHETFFVGPDRAMFLPSWYWFHPRHLLDLFNVLMYYSLPSLLITGFLLFRLRTLLSTDTLFWTYAAFGYFLYAFLWNPDRGYPEDWDLFSPFTLLWVMLVLHGFLSPSQQGTGRKDVVSEKNRAVLYITTMGTLLFSCVQIYFHHIVPFVPPQI